ADRVDLSLVETSRVPENMSVVPGGRSPTELNGFNFELLTLDPFAVDRYEVTNRQFKEFIDRGGYTRREYWKDLRFIKDGRDVQWDDAIRLIVDSTGRPRPSTWQIRH